MTNKTQAKVGAGLTGVFGFIAFLATIPPQDQQGLLGALAQVFPPEWQSTVALWTKLISVVSGFYAIYHASHSGPQTPPLNPPN